MKKHFIYAALALMMMGAQPMMAQGGMTDRQAIEYIKKGVEQGKSQKQLMVELSARGVTKEQALRLKNMYESGQIAGGGAQTGVQDINSRMRQEQAMVALAIFGGIFMHYGLWNFAILAFICVGVIIPFFAYNVFGNADRGRKIFMGDTGSLTLGYIISFFVVKYCMYIPGEDMQAYGAPVVVAFAVLLVPCLDVVRVFLRRIRNGKSPFLPDKTHIHHKFLDMGFTPRSALITIQLMSAAFCLFSFVAVRYLNNTLVFVVDIVVWIGLNIWFNKRIAKRKALQK